MGGKPRQECWLYFQTASATTERRMGIVLAENLQAHLLESMKPCFLAGSNSCRRRTTFQPSLATLERVCSPFSPVPGQHFWWREPQIAIGYQIKRGGV